jgi:hypothetical protein
MKSDLYTKVVLAVIALSLSVIAVQLTTKDAHAQVRGQFLFTESGALIVAICDANGPASRYHCAEVNKLHR